jgi:hypothetical protein
MVPLPLHTIHVVYHDRDHYDILAEIQGSTISKRHGRQGLAKAKAAF